MVASRRNVVYIQPVGRIGRAVVALLDEWKVANLGYRVRDERVVMWVTGFQEAGVWGCAPHRACACGGECWVTGSSLT
jgi:hypothetical protein